MSIRVIELAWYRKNGKYNKSRIAVDACGNEYVIGDWSWNRNPKNRNMQEFCEPEMSKAYNPKRTCANEMSVR